MSSEQEGDKKKKKKEKKEKEEKEKDDVEKKEKKEKKDDEGGEKKKRKKKDDKESRVKVAVRIRPFNRADLGNNEDCLKVNATTISYDNGQKTGSYAFDYVFHETNQEQIFSLLGENMLLDAFSGYNTCIFAYGQTGSGKTYSMLGKNSDSKECDVEDGILPRIAKEIFKFSDEIMAEDATLTIKVQISFLEVYNEKVRDLLQFEGGNPRSKGENLQDLIVRFDKKKKSFVCEGLSTHTVTNWKRIHKLIDIGTSYRAKMESQRNELSSRSHSVFTIYISQTHNPPNPNERDKDSKITIVDLAGSERQSTVANDTRSTEAEKKKLVKESENINQSLMLLGRLLTICSETSDPKHLPIRDSELTKILSDIFGGNTKTVMFATVSPAMINFNETCSTLSYAHNAMKIQNKAKVNELDMQFSLAELRQSLNQLTIEYQKAQAEGDEANGGMRQEIAQLTREKDEMYTQLCDIQSNNDEIRKNIELVKRENSELRAGHQVQHANISIPSNATRTNNNYVMHTSEPMHTSNDNPFYLSTANQPGQTPFSFASSGSGDSSSDDEGDRQQKLWEVQSILREKLPIANPTLPDTARVGSEPNTARGVGGSNEIRSYPGHAGAVYCCAFSPKGDKMVTCSRDGTVKIWNVKNGQELVTMKKHKGYVLSCAFSPSGTEVASSSDDKSVKIWDAESGKNLITMKGHNDRVYSIAYSPSGKELASASSDKSVKVWNTESGKKLQSLRGHNGPVFGVSFGNITSHYLCSGGEDKTIRLWNWVEGKETALFTGHSGTVWSCCFNQNDTMILTAAMDGQIRLWQIETTFPIRTFRGHSGPVHCAVFAKNDDKIVSASRDRTLKIWDTQSGKVLTTLIGHSSTVYKCCVFNNLIISCSSDDSAKTWNLKT